MNMHVISSRGFSTGKANYVWPTEDRPVNFDTHRDGPGNMSNSCEKGRGAAAEEGMLTAGVDGNHG